MSCFAHGDTPVTNGTNIFFVATNNRYYSDFAPLKVIIRYWRVSCCIIGQWVPTLDRDLGRAPHQSGQLDNPSL